MAILLAVFVLVLANFRQAFPIDICCFKKLLLPSTVTGPTSLAFDREGEGPYVSVSDGRVLEYKGPNKGFVEFSYDAPRRDSKACNGVADVELGRACGRPVGVSFDYRTGSLYTTDPYYGLERVGASGGQAKVLVPTKNGVPYELLLGSAVNPENGEVYFTDASSIYGLKDYVQAYNALVPTGRLFKYDPATNNVTELQKNLYGAFGVECSIDGKYLLLSEFAAKRIRKYWLTGEKAGTSEIIKYFPGKPNKIRRNEFGDYWVTVNIRMDNSTSAVPQAMKISPEGKVLAVVDLRNEFNQVLTHVQEHRGKLYVGSYLYNFLGVYKIK